MLDIKSYKKQFYEGGYQHKLGKLKYIFSIVWKKYIFLWTIGRYINNTKNPPSEKFFDTFFEIIMKMLEKKQILEVQNKTLIKKRILSEIQNRVNQEKEELDLNSLLINL